MFTISVIPHLEDMLFGSDCTCLRSQLFSHLGGSTYGSDITVISHLEGRIFGSDCACLRSQLFHTLRAGFLVRILYVYNLLFPI